MKPAIFTITFVLVMFILGYIIDVKCEKRHFDFETVEKPIKTETNTVKNPIDVSRMDVINPIPLGTVELREFVLYDITYGDTILILEENVKAAFRYAYWISPSDSKYIQIYP